MKFKYNDETFYLFHPLTLQLVKDTCPYFISQFDVIFTFICQTTVLSSLQLISSSVFFLFNQTVITTILFISLQFFTVYLLVTHIKDKEPIWRVSMTLINISIKFFWVIGAQCMLGRFVSDLLWCHEHVDDDVTRWRRSSCSHWLKTQGMMGNGWSKSWLV